VNFAIEHLTLATPALDGWLGRVAPLHRALRTALADDYVGVMRCVLAQGAELLVRHRAGVPCALAVFRCYQNTYDGYRFYIDDLVTDPAQRSQGHGAALLAWCEALARERGCDWLCLDSGVQRALAHRFYFREGFAITAYSFRKAITGTVS
jgi:GNAT superfamily N-acetyltransferase